MDNIPIPVDLDDIQDESMVTEAEGAVNIAITLCEASYPLHKNQSDVQANYQVLSSDEIVQYVVDFVEEVNNIIQLQPTISRMLLSHCKWDKVTLMEKFYSDPEKLYKEAHVINPSRVPVSVESEINECEICYTELSSNSSATSTCGHKFCTSCWSEYLKVKIMDGGVGNSITCAANECDVIIDDDTVIALVDDLGAKHVYQHLITNGYVQHNRLLRWCPAPGCSFAIKVDYSPVKPICCLCKCGHEFCFDCSKEWHAPVPCDVLKQFKMHLREGYFTPQPVQPASEQPATVQQKVDCDEKIKRCPYSVCQIHIQKVSGCRVMKCKNCKTLFCWECLERFRTKFDAYGHRCKGDPEAAALQNVYNTTDAEQEPARKTARVALAAASTGDRFPPNDQVGSFTLLTNREDKEPSTSKGSVETARNETFEHKIYAEQWMQQDLCKIRGNINMFGQCNYYVPTIQMRTQNQLFLKYRVEASNSVIAATRYAQIKEELQQCRDKSAKMVDFGKASLEWLRSCQTLKYSAIFVLYLENVTESMLLKNLVIDLEVAVAKLTKSIALVQVFNVKSYGKITEEVLPAYRNCELRHRALLAYVDEGFDNEWWIFENKPKTQ